MKNKLTKDENISENPFDYDYKTVKETVSIAKPRNKQILRLDLLRKKITTKENKIGRKVHRIEIANKLKIKTKRELSFKQIDYYTFPYIETDTNNFIYFMVALKDVLNNYKREMHSFYIKIDGGIISFEREIRATTNLHNLFVREDILCIKDEKGILITDNINMVIDMLINRNSKYVPFIISREKFEYGSLRRFILGEGRRIKSSAGDYLLYETKGYVIVRDLNLEKDDISYL